MYVSNIYNLYLPIPVIDTTHLFQHDALIRVIMHYTRVNMLSLDLIVYCMLVRTPFNFEHIAVVSFSYFYVFT